MTVKRHIIILLLSAIAIACAIACGISINLRRYGYITKDEQQRFEYWRQLHRIHACDSGKFEVWFYDNKDKVFESLNDAREYTTNIAAAMARYDRMSTTTKSEPCGPQVR